MKRREFIALVGGTVATLPLAARAQQPMPVIGFLHTRNQAVLAGNVAPFLKALRDAGFVEGRTVAIEYRFADGHYDRLPAMAGELARMRVAVLIAAGGEPTVLAAKSVTSTIPIIFVMGSDPVKAGVVASFNRPGGNITGIHILTDTLGAKRFGLMHQLLPRETTIGYLFNPRFASAETQLSDVQEAARTLSIKARVLNASTEREIDAAFETIAKENIRALVVGADPFFATFRDKLIAHSARLKLPAIYEFREYPVAGGLISYGVDFLDGYRQAGLYVVRVLKGEKPASLPVLQPTKFEFVINLKTAKALGLEIPPTLLALATEVIE